MSPDVLEIERAVALLEAGELVAFPTETVYGLGANAENASAVARIFAAKGRPSTHPLIVHFSNFAAARAWAAEVPAAAAKLAEAFWPGPLTLVLPRAERVPAAVTGGQPGARSATPGCPPVTAMGTCSALGNTSVSGPGQNASASFAAAAGTSAAQSRAAPKLLKWTMSGCVDGLPLAAKMRATAEGFPASAPSP